MKDKVFVDSNIWVYLFTSEDNAKSKAAYEYITQSAENCHLVISYQVINEVCCVLKKKKYTEPEIRRVANDLMALCQVCDFSGEIFLLASELREKYSFSYWDSQIVASALTSQCDILASEDMHNGLRIDTLIIRSLFP
jgi:predicted nucleic acid-binding protein